MIATPGYLPGNLRLVISVRIPDARLLICITIVLGPTPEAVLRHGLRSLPRFLLSSARGRPREPCFGTARSRIHIHILIQSTGHAHAVCIRPRHSRFHLRRNRGGICAARPASTSRSPAALPALHALIWRRVRVRTWSVWTRCGVCVVLQGISLGPKLVGRRRLLRWILHRRHGSRIRSPPIRHCRLLRRILHMRRGSRISWYSYSAIRPHSARAKPRPGVAPFVRRLRYDRTCRRGLGGGGAAA